MTYGNIKTFIKAVPVENIHVLDRLMLKVVNVNHTIAFAIKKKRKKKIEIVVLERY